MTRTYLVVFERVAEDNWGGWAPDINGAVGAGETLDAVRENLKEGMSIMLTDVVERLNEKAPAAVSTGVDFSAYKPDPATSRYIIEWLTVDLPESSSKTSRDSLQAA